ncbi:MULTISPECIES: ABC transporter permease [Sphingomonas]|jgi:putative ABC transport system permease protein|uniref:Transporter n=1 Tax=Sphingomonas hankookensis TaxID=563996 RepID=A0ABR5YAJ2_9SPHN|nr:MULTISPECIES: ABC transporter permease [Sphingomonas]KZE11866.1 transporter [Sphingomonas hankookensis]PZT93234.1 MAG: transporter [Sphingomonas sp.]WCP70912.1 ABC transporter permease [Sphingomonas hankookensis]
MNGSAWVSLYRSLVRHKLYATLNIGGLALGIAVFCVLALYVRFETSFETWLPHHDEIYLVQTELHLPGSPLNGAYPGTMAGMLEQMRQDFPGVVGTRIRGGTDGGTILRDGEAIRADVAQVDPTFLDIFALPIVQGRGGDALSDPTAALVSRRQAQRLFGDGDPIGQTLTIAVDAPERYHVVGVFDDLPANSDMKLSVVIPIPRTPPPAQWTWYRWGTADVGTYLRFADTADDWAFAAKLPAFVRRRAKQDLGPTPDKVIALSLLPITRMHLEPPGAESGGRRLTVVALGIVGVLTLLIAVVNYVNLATARAGLRAREVAMRKVLGADRATLVRQFLGEAMVTVAIAAFAGLVLAELSLPLLNAAGGLTLAFPYALVVPVLIVLVLVIGVLAGLYPALLLSRFPAAAVLAAAHSPGGGRAGNRLREALVIVQFGMAIAFIIGTAVVSVQVAHLRQADLGFRRDGLLVVPSLADKRIFADRARPVLAAFRQLPGVVAVGEGGTGAGGDGETNVDIIAMPADAGPGVTVMAQNVGPGFFRTYSPTLLAGRFFDDAHRSDDASDWTRWPQGRNIVLNRAAVAALGFRSPADAVGRTVDGAMPRTIVGVIDTLRFFTPRIADQATYYQYNRDGVAKPVAAIRFTGDPAAMLDRVRATWRRLIPDVPFVAQTAEDRLAEFYRADEQAMRLFAIGGGLAVAIACIGLWGLAAFNTARRTREIGIRKTLGASSGDIVRLLFGQFLRPVLIANVIAWPLAYLAMRAWLAGFADRIALSLLYFVGAGLLALAIAVLTVLAQAIRASRAAPAWALRHD